MVPHSEDAGCPRLGTSLVRAQRVGRQELKQSTQTRLQAATRTRGCALPDRCAAQSTATAGAHHWGAPPVWPRSVGRVGRPRRRWRPDVPGAADRGRARSNAPDSACSATAKQGFPGRLGWRRTQTPRDRSSVRVASGCSRPCPSTDLCLDALAYLTTTCTSAGSGRVHGNGLRRSSQTTHSPVAVPRADGCPKAWRPVAFKGCLTAWEPSSVLYRRASASSSGTNMTHGA